MSPRLNLLPEPVADAAVALYFDRERIQKLLTKELCDLTTPSPERMTKAYVLANELVNHIQVIGTLIDELRRYGPEGYRPRLRKEVDHGTLKPVPKKKSPPKAKPGFHALYKEDGSLLGFAHDDYRVRSQREAPMKEAKPKRSTNATIRANLAKARKKVDRAKFRPSERRRQEIDEERDP